MVTPYAPQRDGIGSYALQHVKRLRGAGHHVEVCSPRPSAAHHHLDLATPAGLGALARLARGFDRVLVQFHPDYFYRWPATPAGKASTAVGLGVALRAGGDSELRLHEFDWRWANTSDPTAPLTRWMLRGADRISVHSAEWRTMLIERFRVPAAKVVVVDHGADFLRRTTADRASARATLGLPADGHVLLCIGFLAPHKGFDRAARAFEAAGLAERGARLDIVGSVRVDDPRVTDHVDELRHLARTIEGVHLHTGYVSDEVFDRWIVAADTVVLPYRHIWSSSVAERAALYDRAVIASDLEGLAEQLAGLPRVSLVGDARALAAAMAAAVQGGLDGAPGPVAGSERAAERAPGSTTAIDRAVAAGARPGSGTVVATPWPAGSEREAVQAAIRERAIRERGGPARTAGRDGAPGASPSAPLRRLATYVPPPATSLRPGVARLKRVIRRLVAWELDPITAQLNRLHRATIEALDEQTALLLERTSGSTGAGTRRLDGGSDGGGGIDGPGTDGPDSDGDGGGRTAPTRPA
ncbi:MAG: glycosyltransferase [Actinobacteria bacterium]|nr:glycosyltransferase [Actinomycetota bacterium]